MVELAVVNTRPPLQICESPVEIRASVQIHARSKLAAAIAKGRQIVTLSTSNSKLQNNSAETRRELQNRAISTTIWYSGFTITIRNIIVLIPLHAIVQIIQASCTHTYNMQIVHLAYDDDVLTVTFNHHVTIPASCKVSTIRLSCINHYGLRAYSVNSCTNNNDIYMH